MIVCFMEEGQTTVRVLKEPQEVCSFLGTSVRVVQQAHSVYFRIPHVLRYMIKNPIRHGSRLVLENQDTGQIGTVCFSAYDKDYARFRRLKRNKERMTFGSCIDCDLYLQDENLSSNLTLDWSTHTIQDPSCFFFPNGQREFKMGDRVSILNTVLVFHEDFFMINCVQNLYTSIPTYSPPLIKEPLPMCAGEPCTPQFRAPVLDGTFQEELPEPLPMKERTFQPLRFSIGPAVLMSFAAMLNAVLSSIRMVGTFDLEKSISMLVFPCVMLLSTLLFHPMQRAYEKKQIRLWNQKREAEYNQYLLGLESRIQTHRKAYEQEMKDCFPWPFEESFRTLYKQKTKFQVDFMQARIGDAEVEYDLQLKQSFRFALSDPLSLCVQQLKQRYAKIHVPVLLDCTKQGCVAIAGCEWEQVLESLLVQICATVGDRSFRMVVLAEEEWVRKQDWVVQIPQLYDESYVRYVVTNVEDAQKVCGLLKQNPQEHLLIVAQNARVLSWMETEQACVLLGCPDGLIPSFCSSYYLLGHRPVLVQQGRSIQLDPIDPTHRENMNQVRISDGSLLKRQMGNAFLNAFGVDRIEDLKIMKNWQATEEDEHLLARIGQDERGEVQILDLSEKGHGPHGLIAGTTGSGKSEFLLSMILSLAIAYAPDRLNFILIDFKGASCAHALSERNVMIPHVSGVVSNLDCGRIDRALVSFQNECKHRQNLFHELSVVCDRNISSLPLYRKARKEHPEFDVLADLLIIVDEFAELKKEYPEFMKELISISRIGRSLGLHLILSTQRPMGVVDEQIFSNSRFKICLKVQEPQDSKELLHRPDAAWIQRPGEYYCLCDDGFRHGQSAYTGGPAKEDVSEVRVLDSMGIVKRVFRENQSESGTLAHELVHQILVDGQVYGAKARAIWKPEPQQVSIKDAPKDSVVYFGLGDAYHENRHVWVGWDRLLDAHVAVFTDQKKERSAFLDLFLYSFLSTATREEELAVVDESGWLEGKEDLVNACIRSERALQLYLNHVVHCRSCVTILFTDLASFLRQSQNCTQILHDLLTMKVYEHVHVVVFAATSQMIPYRDYGFFSRRIALACKSTSVLSGIFETGVKTIVQAGHMLVFEEHFLDVRLALCTASDLDEIRSMRSSTTRFPFQKEPWDPMITEDGRRLVGITKESCLPVWIDKDELLVVDAQEGDMIQHQRWLLPGARMRLKQEVLPGSDSLHAHELYMGLSAETKAPELFLRNVCSEHEALHVYRGRKELIELVRPWNSGVEFVFLLCADLLGS